MQISTTSRLIRVLIVDDHAVVRRGLTDILLGAQDMNVVGTACDGHEAHLAVKSLLPDVVLMDLQMPRVGGLEATRRISEEYPQVQVLVLTTFYDRDRLLAALDAGAVGYLIKDNDPREVIAGVRTVFEGGSPIDPRAARTLLKARGRPTARLVLTPRESEVLTLVRLGLTNKQIARRLGITERTVKAHLTSTFQRVGVSDRTQAAVWATVNGL